MTARGFRIGLAGATGALGRELLEVIEARRLPVSELIPFATERSMGRDVEIFGEPLPVLSETPPLRGLDLLILCTPPDAALDLVRAALHAQVPCIDCSGAMAKTPEVPLFLADMTDPAAVTGAPLVATPAGAALVWTPVLSALEGVVGVERVVGTLLRSASRAGRRGIQALSDETMSLLNQREAPESDVFPAPVAFDCVPIPGEEDDEAELSAACERELARDLNRLISADLEVAVSAVQVPVFAGEGATLAIETKGPIQAERAREIFDKTPGLELREKESVGPTTRETAGRDLTLVGRVRQDPSRENGLLMWLAADTLRLAAVNAAKLAEIRLGVG